MPFEAVWDRGGYVFSELVYEYSRNELPPQQILGKHYEKYPDKENKERFRFKSANNETFAPRYVTSDYESILQTLEILNYQQYRRSIIAYIVSTMRRFQSEGDLLMRVACALHLLTYQLDGEKVNHGKAVKILKDDREFNERVKTFKRNSTSGKKRLWCCVRDYKKGLYHRIFNEAIREAANDDAQELVNVWNKLPMDQIELPGDVWNNSPLFRDNLFAKVLDIGSIPKIWGMPKVIRELYNQLKGNGEINDFYPEQFDITFDFVPRMCNKRLCSVCLFGKNGVDRICIPTHNKYCPVALVSCGYKTTCVEEQRGCILKGGISKGICKGGLGQT